MQKLKEKSNNISFQQNRADHEIEVTIYTDPLCCWSWAFEPQLQELKSFLGDRAGWQYRMGGLLSSWNNFHDEVNSVTRPVQMGPVWMHAGQIANMPIHHQLWMKDPPSSSYPACIAVKCAQLQSDEFGEEFLRYLREAAMSEGKNVDKEKVLFEVAKKVASTNSAFDVNKFKEDYKNGTGTDAFRADLELVRYHNINRFPTLIIKSRNEKAIIVSGYRPYTEVLKAMKTIIPDITIPI